jgi:hypothetical protein
MRRLAEVVFEPLEQRCDICAGAEGEVFSRHFRFPSARLAHQFDCL